MKNSMESIFLNEIEQLNLDYLELKESKEYRIGKKMLALRSFTLRKAIKAIRSRFYFRSVHQFLPRENLEENERAGIARPAEKLYKIAVYSCVTGQYDSGNCPYIYPSGIQYVMYSDQETYDGWSIRRLPPWITDVRSGIYINRYVKFHPFELFGGEYDYAVYLDGNITPVSDLSVWAELTDDTYGIAFHEHCGRSCIYEEYKACRAMKKGNLKHLKKQMLKYKKEGFPKDYGMLEGNAFIVNLKNDQAKRLLHECWKELCRTRGGRDQIVWPYILWKNHIRLSRITTLGKNVYRDAKLRITDHM